ncbi:MAG: pyridoxine 5'-phosphate synthase [Candidatus Omnitrophica bacterium]|nr:pyridoxine 5'-phosphate synthase [Candidatus Omnitrophota bacterium]MDD5027210.1 pyridoxine 5'-phosphate synthase [Candidatus Omnitrophota bacterium]MDD5661722.1 pyridoxine 5'-phosphate synthase [Candidatus Omnitrophota bacterium]
MMRLGVNIDHIATLRQARGGLEPEPVFGALIAEAAGADAIVAHLREDQRHIKDKDIFLLKEVVNTRFNLEMSIAPEIIRVASKIKPDQATLVPERRRELTTEGGLNVVKKQKKIGQAVKKLETAGIEVSLFIDPNKNQIRAAKKTGARFIELHTGAYANARTKAEENKRVTELKSAVVFARGIGLRVFAGHGLNYNNVSRIAALKEIEELNIGHAIISRAVFSGLGRAVGEMKDLIK